MMVVAVVTMVVIVGLIGCGVVSSLDCGSRYRLPHAYSQTKDHMAMASVRMHGRRTETPPPAPSGTAAHPAARSRAGECGG